MQNEYNCFIEELKNHLKTASGKSEDCFIFKSKEEGEDDLLLMECTSRKNARGYCALHTEQLYAQYRSAGGTTLDDLVQEILRAVGEVSESELDFVQDALESYENARSHLFIRLLNYEAEKEKLQGSVYYRLEDIAMVLFLQVRDQEHVLSSTRVPASVLSFWECDQEMVFREAMLNTYFLTPPRVYRWEKMLKDPDYRGENFMDLIHPCTLTTEPQGNCLSTVRKTNGAVAIFLPGVADRIADLLEDDLYLAFTSIHEVMVHGVGTVDPEGIREVLKSTIKESTPPEDFLTDKVYRYDRRTRHFSCLE